MGLLPPRRRTEPSTREARGAVRRDRDPDDEKGDAGGRTHAAIVQSVPKCAREARYVVTVGRRRRDGNRVCYPLVAPVWAPETTMRNREFALALAALGLIAWRAEAGDPKAKSLDDRVASLERRFDRVERAVDAWLPTPAPGSKVTRPSALPSPEFREPEVDSGVWEYFVDWRERWTEAEKAEQRFDGLRRVRSDWKGDRRGAATIDRAVRLAEADLRVAVVLCQRAEMAHYDAAEADRTGGK